MFCTLTFYRGLRFWRGLLVLKFTAAVRGFTWAYFFVGGGGGGQCQATLGSFQQRAEEEPSIDGTHPELAGETETSKPFEIWVGRD